MATAPISALEAMAATVHTISACSTGKNAPQFSLQPVSNTLPPFISFTYLKLLTSQSQRLYAFSFLKSQIPMIFREGICSPEEIHYISYEEDFGSTEIGYPILLYFCLLSIVLITVAFNNSCSSSLFPA